MRDSEPPSQSAAIAGRMKANQTFHPVLPTTRGTLDNSSISYGLHDDSNSCLLPSFLSSSLVCSHFRSNWTLFCLCHSPCSTTRRPCHPSCRICRPCRSKMRPPYQHSNLCLLRACHDAHTSSRLSTRPKPFFRNKYTLLFPCFAAGRKPRSELRFVPREGQSGRERELIACVS